MTFETDSKEATVYTDESGQYRYLGHEFAKHDFVGHTAGEYGRGPVHTNTIEGYFSIFKRGMKGVYQHCAKKHQVTARLLLPTEALISPETPYPKRN